MKTMKKFKAGQQGFTLIELIVVIAVLAILAVIILPRFMGFTESASEKAALSDARNVLTAMEAQLASDPGLAPDDIDGADLADYVTLNGDFTNKSAGDTVSFEYVLTSGGKTYTASVIDGVLQPDVAIGTAS